MAYFNHYFRIAEDRWQRRTFAHSWWRIYSGDPRWTPPYYPDLRRDLEPGRNSHLARLAPLFVYSEAMPRRDSGSGGQNWGSVGPMFEQTVAAAVILQDPRRRDNTAYLALWRMVNDAETAERFLDKLAELMWSRRCRRLIGPTGLSPHLGAGLLEDCWDRTPPLHTAYDPPYVPEIIHSHMAPLGRRRLYHLEIPPEPVPVPAGPAALGPLAPERLATDLLPLLAAACPVQADAPPPDADEAAFLLRRLGRWPLYGWLAHVEGQPAGFVLLQPDLARRLRRAGGGRNPAWRLWLRWAAGRPAGQGRLLYGGVLPEWRGRGIGRQLLDQALHTARGLGWRSLSAGPLPPASAGAKFLEKQGARPEQSYGLYQREL